MPNKCLTCTNKQDLVVYVHCFGMVLMASAGEKKREKPTKTFPNYFKLYHLILYNRNQQPLKAADQTDPVNAVMGKQLRLKPHARGPELKGSMGWIQPASHRSLTPPICYKHMSNFWNWVNRWYPHITVGQLWLLKLPFHQLKGSGITDSTGAHLSQTLILQFHLSPPQ